MQILLSRTQAGLFRAGKQEHEEISRNHIQTFSGGPVQLGTRLSNRVGPRLCEVLLTISVEFTQHSARSLPNYEYVVCAYVIGKIVVGPLNRSEGEANQ